ncbi:MAG: zinc ribbon domain-containing protein [Clostridia bacterium]|nr:zinc ribbon domain-containing protein [Clostridia bacterium]
MFCEICGQQLESTDKFCPACGNRVQVAQPEQTPSYSEEPEQSYTPDSTEYIPSSSDYGTDYQQEDNIRGGYYEDNVDYGPPPEKKNGGKGALIAVLLIVLLLGIGFGAFWFVNGRKLPESDTSNKDNESTAYQSGAVTEGNSVQGATEPSSQPTTVNPELTQKDVWYYDESDRFGILIDVGEGYNLNLRRQPDTSDPNNVIVMIPNKGYATVLGVSSKDLQWYYVEYTDEFSTYYGYIHSQYTMRQY